MKHLHYLVLLLLLSGSTHAQEFIYQWTNFSSSFNVTDVEELTDGSLVAVLEGDSTYIAKMTPAGGITWSTKFRYQSSQSSLDYLMPMSDGGFMNYGRGRYSHRATFSVRDSNANVTKDTLLKLSSSSVPLTYALDAVEDHEGNIYFAGYAYDIFSGGVSFFSWRIPFVGKLNSDLQLQWVKTFATHNYSNRRTGIAHSIAIGPDSNLVINGIHSFRSGYNTGRQYLAKITRSGNLVWAREQAMSSSTSPMRVEINEAGDIFAMKYMHKNDIGTTTNMAKIDKFDASGNLLWTRLVNKGNTTFFVGDMGLNSDSDIILAGYFYENSAYSSALAIIDSSGTFVNAPRLVSDTSGSGTRASVLKVLSNDQFLVGGYTDNGPVMFRTDASGYTDCLSDTALLFSSVYDSAWSTGVNLGYYGMTYDTDGNYFTGTDNHGLDSFCFVAPACDVTASFSWNGGSICGDQNLQATNTSSGTGVSVDWFIGSTQVSSASVLDTNLDAGTYQITLIADGAYCDDTVTQSLTVHPAYNDSHSVSLCVGDQYVALGQTFTSDTVVTDTFALSTGCDSVVTYTLQFDQSYTAITDTICSGESLAFGGQNRTQTGTYYDTLTAANTCDSIVELSLQVLPVPTTSLTASICSGESMVFAGDTLTSSGQYFDTLTAANGCDSIVDLTLTVLPVSITVDVASICDGESYTSGGQVYSTSGQFTDTLTAANGCDSIINLTLTVLDVDTTVLVESICQGESYAVGSQSYNTTGQYSDTLTGTNGCDSIVELTLTVLSVPTTSLTATICAGESYAFGGANYTSSGQYFDTLTAANTCDSIVDLTLTVLPVPTTSLTASICSGESYAFGGQSYTTSGQYFDTLTAANGCDSIVDLTLTILPVPTTALDQNICDGESYDFGGETYTTTGQYMDTLTAANGCDSIITLTLTVLPVPTTSLTASICDGESYAFGGQAYSSSGLYYDTLIAANGCDSIVDLTLTVLPVFSTELYDTICAGESYAFGGQSYSTAGAYSDILTAANGCDSVLNLTLTVLPVFTSAVSDSICAGDTLVFLGNAYTNAGLYYDTLTATNGCDSIIALLLSVLPVSNTSISESICDGEVFEFGGQSLGQAGTYYDTLTAANGCDSIITLQLSILDHAHTNLEASVCIGDTFDFNGDMLTSAGTYQQMYMAANGCDSTVSLELTVLPNKTGSSFEVICQEAVYIFGDDTLSEAGTYTNTFIASTGCDSIHTLTLKISTVHAKIQVSVDTLKSVFEADVYEWINCSDNSSTGLFGPYFIPGNQQAYALVVHDANGCTDTSECAVAQPVGVAGVSDQDIRVYPNPAGSEVTISGIHEPITSAQWIDASGRIVSEVKHTLSNVLPTPPATGLYMLRIHSASATYRHRVVVVR